MRSFKTVAGRPRRPARSDLGRRHARRSGAPYSRRDVNGEWPVSEIDSVEEDFDAVDVGGLLRELAVIQDNSEGGDGC